jgi:hypothetical protein
VPAALLRDRASAIRHRVTHEHLCLRAQPCNARDLAHGTGTFPSDDEAFPQSCSKSEKPVESLLEPGAGSLGFLGVCLAATTKCLDNFLLRQLHVVCSLGEHVRPVLHKQMFRSGDVCVRTPLLFRKS